MTWRVAGTANYQGHIPTGTPRKIIQTDTIRGLLATSGAALLSLGGAQTAGTSQDIWLNPWFDGGFTALSASVVPPVILAVVSWWRSRRTRTPHPGITAQERPADDQDSPLRLLPQRGVWRIFGGTVWGFGIPVRVTNVTEEPITLAYYRLLHEPDGTHRLSPAPEIQAAADAWIATLSAEHGSELFIGEIVIPPGESIIRWFIGLAHAPLPDGGRPALTLQFEDVDNDTYEKIIPGRPRRIFRSLQNRDCAAAGGSPAARHASLARFPVEDAGLFITTGHRTFLRSGAATCRTAACPGTRDRLI